MSARDSLEPDLVADRLRQAAALFQFRDVDTARAAMEGRLASDGTLYAAADSEPFASAVARRLGVLRALDRRRRALTSKS